MKMQKVIAQFNYDSIAQPNKMSMNNEP